MTAQLDPYEIYTDREEEFNRLVEQGVEDLTKLLDNAPADEVEWDLGTACSIDPDDTCESCQ